MSAAKLPRKRGSTLGVIASLLIGSAVIRVFVATGPAMAEEREARVSVREAELEERLEALAFAETQITDQLQALTDAEERLRATIALADAAAETDLTQLTSVYENMKPKDAAALFEEMEANFAAGFLGLMRPDAAAAIMAGLTPEKAYEISVLFAGRNANVPTE